MTRAATDRRACSFSGCASTGFISFVEPVECPIEPGLTGVVGPNGCGKSNRLEALRWVTGASSAKNLRADGVDEVIFGGPGACAGGSACGAGRAGGRGSARARAFGRRATGEPRRRSLALVGLIARADTDTDSPAARRSEQRARLATLEVEIVTTSRMDRMIGITMAERGVAQLVSIDLARAAALAPA